MKRLEHIKQLVSERVLPQFNHMEGSYHAVVSAFAFSYSSGRSLLQFCRHFGLHPNSSRILIVGAHGGRDYYWLTGHRYRVDILDLGTLPWGSVQYVGDACKSETWSAIKAKYDLIVMCDVLEHLPEDFRALQQARRALKDTGYLFISVPYSLDPEPTHVRSYSKLTLRRLLLMAGYDCVWERDRPGLLEAFPTVVNSFNYGAALLMPTIRGGAILLECLLRLEFFINEKTRAAYRIFGRSPQKGILMGVTPKQETMIPDYVRMNRQSFIVGSEANVIHSE